MSRSSFRSSDALYILIGIETNPKLIEPFQIDLISPAEFPVSNALIQSDREPDLSENLRASSDHNEARSIPAAHSRSMLLFLFFLLLQKRFHRLKRLAAEMMLNPLGIVVGLIF